MNNVKRIISCSKSHPQFLVGAYSKRIAIHEIGTDALNEEATPFRFRSKPCYIFHLKSVQSHKQPLKIVLQPRWTFKMDFTHAGFNKSYLGILCLTDSSNRERRTCDVAL
ncbi:hypothetical protein NPIL_139071 [Nephila pilipes]|uniref:Uncharacterized protein n=1 Tax=Nephila pilipes TaxID=299642 RepID=A0A8X6PGA8_NEPPI|nr:hypothetical protein NPIL_139071 [Nephila pilipes]